MRVYISADMEGATGLVGAHDVQPGAPDYEHGRAMMTEDVNAAVRGALSAGATRVLVNDAHGSMRNMLAHRLHPRAELVRGKPKRMGMLEGLDGSFDAVMCVGYHARAGALGVLSHSFMGHEIEDMWLDDRPMGEFGFVHATSTALGVPVVMLSGDDAACEEATAWDARVVTAPVKYARDRFSARLRPVAEARGAIEQAAAEGAGRAASQGRPPGTDAPATLAVRWQSATVAAQLEAIPGAVLRDSRTIEVAGPVPGLFRLFGLFMRVAASITDQQPYC
ncbi:M55 family metallopeptidase [Streptomyces palmae]|uniref:Peptidase M55 n=1 Tax=Streptomyces palmae TaxID=1701085 RepID=A0A4Z0H6E2_9ACTN|nr:M55 family metallopeptidase [Streptomyces palmae]TGB08314.1 peptidase M55 [Streptomyces palmae]